MCRVHGIIGLNRAKYVKIWFFGQRWSRAKIWKIFKVGKHIDGGVIDMCLQGRIFKAFSEKPKNAIKIKIGCVVTEWESFELNPDHLWPNTLYIYKAYIYISQAHIHNWGLGTFCDFEKTAAKVRWKAMHLHFRSIESRTQTCPTQRVLLRFQFWNQFWASPIALYNY